MIKILAIALGLAQLRGCADSFCTALGMERYSARKMRLAATTPERIVDFAAVGRGALLVVTRADNSPEDHECAVQRWSERGGAEPLFRVRLRDVIGEGIAAARDGQWWYTVAGSYENQWGTLFVSSTGSAVPRFVALPLHGGNRWLALKGDVPAGLYLFQDQQETQVMEVTAEGIRRTWALPGARFTLRGWWAAERLADGSIALASLEGSPDRLPSKVILRVLRNRGAEPSYDEFVLQNGREAVRIVSAAPGSGVVAVVVERPLGAIEAFMVDPKTGKSTRLTLSTSEEKARFPAVAATATGFVVAWADVAARPAALRARSLEHNAVGMFPATIGPLAVSPDREPSLGIASEDEEDVFVWERGDGSAQRRLPADLAGFELLSDLRERLCSFGRGGGRS